MSISPSEWISRLRRAPGDSHSSATSRGAMTRVLGGQGSDPGSAQVDQTLVKAVVRSREGFGRLASGEVESFAESVTGCHVARVIPLAFFVPDIVASILAGTQPVDLTAQKLIKQIDLPLD